MSDAELAELVRLYWDGVWGQRRLELIDELMADPYTRHSAAGTRRMRRAELKGEFVQYWRVLYDAVTTVDDQVIAGDRVWTRATMKGRRGGERGDLVDSAPDSGPAFRGVVERDSARDRLDLARGCQPRSSSLVWPQWRRLRTANRTIMMTTTAPMPASV